MDEQANNNDTPRRKNITLGGGVDIEQPKDDVDDIEIESYNSDIVHEEDQVTPGDRIKLLRKKLHDCGTEKQEYLDGWQRLKADFVNFKKREDEGKDNFIKFAREGLIADILPVLESFQMAFANKDAWEKVDPSWRSGVEYIHTQLLQVLEGHGLSREDPKGKDFNPKEYTSVGSIHTEDNALLHKVAEVVQYGYRLNGKLIKSPKVKIYGDEKDDATFAGKAM